jgi:ADP-heptose:LPS heptosyltransferase
MKPQNILIIRTDRIGDLLMNVPLIHRLKENFPECKITLACNEINQTFMRCHPLLDETMLLDPPKLKISSYRKHIIKLLKEKKFDCVIVPAPDKFYHFLSFRMGAKYRIGFNRKWGIWLNDKIVDVKDCGSRHEFDCNLDLLDRICPEKWSGNLNLGFDSHPQREKILKKFNIPKDGKVVVFHMSTSNDAKSWPIENFKEVINRVKERNCHVVLVGAGDDLNSELGNDLNNIINKTSLDELAIILNRANCCVSLDSGPYHLAWMQKTPVVGIFIKEAVGSNPVRWGVYPNFVKCKQFYDSASNIKPSMIYDAINEMI